MNTTGIEVLRPLPREATKKGLEEKIKRKNKTESYLSFEFSWPKTK